MIFCKQCKQRIVNNNYYYLDATNEYLCSDDCRVKFARKMKKDKDKKKLFDLICRIYKLKAPTPQQFAEWKKCNEQEGLSDSQIASILHYIYEIKNFRIYSQSLLIVLKFHEEARDWYLENQKRQEHAKEIVKQSPAEIRRVNPVNTSVLKRRGTVEINPEDV